MQQTWFDHLRSENAKRTTELYGHPIDPAVQVDELGWTVTTWVLASAGELGEAINNWKKLRRGDDLSRYAVVEELADTMIYLDLAAAKVGHDFPWDRTREAREAGLAMVGREDARIGPTGEFGDDSHVERGLVLVHRWLSIVLQDSIERPPASFANAINERGLAPVRRRLAHRPRGPRDDGR